MKPYPAYKPTGLKWLPKVPRGWDVLHIRELFSERRVKVSDKDYPPLSVSRGGIVPQIETVAKSDDGDNRKLVKKGDFVINSRSDRKSSSGVSQLDGSVSLINIVLQPREQLAGAYAHYLLKCHDFAEEFYRNGRGIVGDLWTTRYSEMKSISLPIPTLKEQASISAYLDAKTAKIDRLIKLKEREIELLQEKKQVVISTVVTRGLDPNAKLVDSGVAWLGKTPQGWKVMPLKRLLNSRVSGSWGMDVPSGEGMICLRIADFDYPHGIFKDTPEDELTHRGYQEREVQELTLEQGDILVEKSGGGDKFPVGRAVMFDKPYKALYANFMDRLRVDRRKALPAFYLHWWRTMYARGVVWPYVKQTTGIQNLDFGNLLAREYIAVPELEEQRRIVDVITERITPIDRAIAVMRRQIELLREYRTRLISDAVTGRIDLRKEAC